jgi:hypothetical protein
MKTWCNKQFFLSFLPKEQVLMHWNLKFFFHLMINMRIIFDFITMMLINHISNMHSNRFFSNIYLFIYLFYNCFWLSRLVQVAESKWMIEYSPFSYNVALKCTCKFSTCKYYRRIHQTSNEKVGLNSIWLVTFKHICYLFLLCQSFSNFVITSLETQRKALYFYYFIFNLLFSTCVKN